VKRKKECMSSAGSKKLTHCNIQIHKLLCLNSNDINASIHNFKKIRKETIISQEQMSS